MKTSTLQVHDMLSVLSVDGVEKRIGDVPGVESVTVDFAAGRATVRYDETRLSNADIKSGVRQRGFDSTETPAETTLTTRMRTPRHHSSNRHQRRRRKRNDSTVV